MARKTNVIQARVFISHQWRDKQLADRLARDLEAFADVWMDYRNLRPGDPIQNMIDETLKEMDLVLLVWSEHAQKSSGVEAEIGTCLNLGLRIVPCIFMYDDKGKPCPPLPTRLNQILAVDFHHYLSGLAQVANLILQLQSERLPEEKAIDTHPGGRMLQYLRGYVSYLANYRNLQDVPDERADWVNKIIGEIERYVNHGGDRKLVQMLLQAALRSEADDPEGIGTLVSRLKLLLGGDIGATRPTISTAEPTSRGGRPALRKIPAPTADKLRQRVAEKVPAGTVDACLSQVDTYLASAHIVLEALTSYTQQMRSQAGCQVVVHLQNYLNDPNDLNPDQQGRYGLLDDAWLILNTAFRLIESGLVPANVLPIDWRPIIAADYVVRSLIPQEALAALTTIVFQMLQIIAAEASSYQPWFTPYEYGYAPLMAVPASFGGTWEDQMNAALLGTGLSVDS